MKKMMRVIPYLLFAPLTLGIMGCDDQNIVQNGKIVISGNVENGTIHVKGIDDLTNLKENAEVTLEIEAKEGYELVSVKVNDEDVTSTLKFTITDVSKDYTIEILFKEKAVEPDPDKPVEPDPDIPVEPDPDIPVDPDPDKPVDPDPDKPVDPDPDIPVDPDIPDPQPDKNKEIIDGVTYTFENNLVVEKIYDPKYIGDYANYSGVNKNEFYGAGYESAQTYNDAMARTDARLLSGDYTIPKNIPNYKNISNPKSETGPAFFNARARYIYEDSTCSGDPIGYILNDTDGDDSNDSIIFRGAAYISMDEVSAYLWAFNEIPANWIPSKSKSGQRQAIDNWGNFGRVNNGFFSGDPNRFPFQPILTGSGTDFNYRETDFGTDGDFLFYDVGGHPNVPQTPYNDGNKIARGTCRFCYTFESTNGLLDEGDMKHVFYTWSHYNDFEEYLNYKGGYGPKFGNLVSGNEYNSKNPENPVSQPSEYILATFNY